MKPKWLLVAEKEIGQKEIPGPTNNKRILEYHQATSLKAQDEDTSWCQTGDGEILTEEGWCSLDQLPKNIKVVQVNPDTLTTSLVLPTNYYERDVSEDIVYINSRALSTGFDTHHLFYGKPTLTYRDGEENKFIAAKDLKYFRIPLFATGGSGYPITDKELQFLAAFLGDGNYMSYKSGIKSSIRFNVAKPEKLHRLREFEPYHEYSRLRPYGLNKLPVTMLYFAYPEWFSDVFTDYKQLRWDFIFQLSKDQLNVFLDEYLKFDGTRCKNNHLVFYTTSPILKDQLMTMIALAGYRAFVSENTNEHSSFPSSKILYNISWSTNKKNFTFSPRNKCTKFYSGKLYGVSVPEGLVVIRSGGGSPVLSGNCASFVGWCLKQAGYKPSGLANARSYLEWGVKLDSPIVGCIVVFKRTSNPALGHVAFYLSEDEEHIEVCGGNQGNSVSIAQYKKADLLGYRWPKEDESAPDVPYQC